MHIGFEKQHDTIILDCLMCGYNIAVLQTRLLKIPDRTLDLALKNVLAMEASQTNANDILHKPTGNSSVCRTYQSTFLRRTHVTDVAVAICFAMCGKIRSFSLVQKVRHRVCLALGHGHVAAAIMTRRNYR